MHRFPLLFGACVITLYLLFNKIIILKIAVVVKFKKDLVNWFIVSMIKKVGSLIVFILIMVNMDNGDEVILSFQLRI